MKSRLLQSRTLLGIIACLCIGFLLFALFLQHFRDVLPCPLCVLQRYAYLFVAVFCVAGFLLNRTRIFSALALLASLIGVGLAGYQLWVESHPSISCGNDPLERAINQLFTAKMWPFLFRSEGLCSDIYDPILGLSAPQWSLVWFVVFALTFSWIIMRRR